MGEKASRIELTPLTFLHRAAEALGERTAVVHGERRYDYAELQARCRRLASALLERGLERHDRVAVLCPNTPALLEAHYGVPLAGGVLVAMNTRLNSDEIAYILRDSGARLLLVDAELQPLVEEADVDGLETVVVQDTGEEDDPYEQLLASGSADPPEHAARGRGGADRHQLHVGHDRALRRAPSTRTAGAYLRAHGVALETRMGYDTVHLWTLPMFHCNGWCLTWGVTAVAGTHVCLRKVEPARIWELLEEEGVTHYSGAPTIHINIANHEQRAPARAARDRAHGRLAADADDPHADARAQPPPDPPLRPDGDLRAGDGLQLAAAVGRAAGRGAGAACSRARATRTTAPTWCGWSTRRCTTCRATARRSARWSCAATASWPATTTSRTRRRRPSAAAGSTPATSPSGTPTATSTCATARRTSSSRAGRTSPASRSSRPCPSIPTCSRSAVVAMPDEKWGERPKAFVEAKEGADLSEEDIIAFCRDNLARFKCPASVEFGELPRTSTGKVQKFVLREREWAGREKAIG